MGVKGLWKLLECVGRPVTLESLKDKVLGVDASVIVNQSVKGMRDKHGHPVPNAHLVGLFNRLCKLLYYGIKPVFVFDGGVPHLKKKTLALRKEQRFKAVHKSGKVAEKIVKNYLKAKALEAVTKRKSAITPVRSKSPREPDVFELPPLPSSAATDVKSSSEDEEDVMQQFHSQHLEETFQDRSAINIDSEDFKALPAEIQHELIKEIKAERKWISKNYVPRQATDFSSFQLEGVLKRGKMNQRLDELCKEMNERNSGELAGIVSHDSVDEHTAVKSQKILSEDTAHYILIKRNELQQAEKQDKQDIDKDAPSKDFSSEGGFFREDQDSEIVSWAHPRPKPSAAPTVPSFDIPELCSSDSEILSPFVDVAEASLSPTSPHAKRASFSFSPVKNLVEKNSVENTVSRMGVIFVDKEEARKNVSQSCNKLGSRNEAVKCDHEDFNIDQLRERSDQELGETSMKVTSEDADLLTQIKDKKQELADLIKKLENSRNQKAVIDLTATSNDGLSENSIEKIQLPQGSSESVDVIKISEKQLECSNFEETKSLQSVLVIDDQATEQDKVVDAVCISESESETSSVEELTVLVKPKNDVVEDTGKSYVSADVLQVVQTTLSTNCTDDVVEDENSSVSHDVLQVVQTTLSKDASNETHPVDILQTETQKDPELHVESQEKRETPVMDKQDSLEESRVGMDVDEPVAGPSGVPEAGTSGILEAGPSGLPVEWQGATVEELEDIRLDLEAEQKSLASEHGRQNRIAATVSNEMYTECQELLELFGVPYLVSPMEAEAQCAMLDVLDLTQGSITDDSDIFLFGGRRVYKNIFNQKRHAEMYGSDAVLRMLALDRSGLICIAFITGSDYTEGIEGVGTVGAMEILHEFSGEGLEGLKKFKLWHDAAQKRTKDPQETKVKRKLKSVVLPSEFPSEEVYEAYLHPVVDESTELFEWAKPDLHSLRLFASEKLGWSSSKTDEVLLPVLKQLNDKEKQMKIDQYFQVEFHERRKVKSKRIQRVLNRTFNPSSSDSDGEDGEKNDKKQNTDKISEKTTKVKQLQHNKRSHSRETITNEEEENDTGVNQPKRAKEKNDIGGACSPTVNRCRSGRGRGRGRGIARKDVNTTPVESSNQEAGKKHSLERKETSSPRPSTFSDNDTETPLNSVRASGAQTGRKCRGTSINRRGKESKSLDKQENSTSDSTDSEDNDGNFYAGPKPVSVFRRGRGRGKERGRGSGRKRGR